MKKKDERPIIDFNLPGFLGLVKKQGAERAALKIIEDLLVMAQKVVSGGRD